MTSIYTNWESSWTNTSINASTVTDGSSATTSSAISNDTKSATEVSITVAYGATANEGIVVTVLRDVDGTNFEAVADLPWGMAMPFDISTTFRRTFTISAEKVSSFKVRVSNDSGASVTVSVKYKQAIVEVV